MEFNKANYVFSEKAYKIQIREELKKMNSKN